MVVNGCYFFTVGVDYKWAVFNLQRNLGKYQTRRLRFFEAMQGVSSTRTVSIPME